MVRILQAWAGCRARDPPGVVSVPRRSSGTATDERGRKNSLPLGRREPSPVYRPLVRRRNNKNILVKITSVKIVDAIYSFLYAFQNIVVYASFFIYYYFFLSGSELNIGQLPSSDKIKLEELGI